MSPTENHEWHFDKTIRINDIIKWLLLLVILIGGYFNLEDKIDDHIMSTDIHQTTEQKEKKFVKKEIYAKDQEILNYQLNAINKKLDDLIKQNNKGR